MAIKNNDGTTFSETKEKAVAKRVGEDRLAQPVNKGKTKVVKADQVIPEDDDFEGF